MIASNVPARLGDDRKPARVVGTSTMHAIFTTSEYQSFALEDHQSMLSDDLRLDRLNRALACTIRPGDVVVDLGTGTGILAFLAYRHGAGKVIAIDESEVIDMARQVKRLNFPRAPIHFKKLDALRSTLPGTKADVIVCELIGYFGIGEDLLQVVPTVRDALLKPGGKVVPSRLELWVSPVESPEFYEHVSFWSRPVGGIDFSPFQRLAYNSAYRVQGGGVRLLGDPVQLIARDLLSSRPSMVRASCRLPIRRSGSLHGFVGFFRANLAEDIELTNDPRDPATHWGQVFLPVGPGIPVRRDDTVDLRFRESKAENETRWSWSGAVRSAKARQKIWKFRRFAAGTE